MGINNISLILNKVNKSQLKILRRYAFVYFWNYYLMSKNIKNNQDSTEYSI